MQRQPTAKNAQMLLQKELEACYRACHLPYPGWDALLNIEDYPDFLADHLKTTTLSPNHPLVHLMRPVLSFYDQVKDLLPAVEQIGVIQLIDRVKPLFAKQSRPCAELMLAAIKAGQLRLIAGEFLPEQTVPTILQPGGNRIYPDCTILATGFTPSIFPYPPSDNTHCYRVTGTSLSAVHQQAENATQHIISSILRKPAGHAIYR